MDRARRRAASGLGRALVAHLVAYPIAVVWIVGATPLCFPIFERALTRASGDVALWGVVPMPAAAAIVFRGALVVGAIAFGLEHLVGLVWALDDDAARGRRRFAVTSLALGAAGALIAAGGWLWFVVHYG